MVQNLILTNFRNFASLHLTLKPGINIIVGKNGTGKTNILESIYYAAMTKSGFQNADKQLVKIGSDFFRIESTINQNQLICKFQAPRIKSFEWNENTYSKLSDHIGKIPIILVNPQDVYELISDHDLKRKFVNQILVQTEPKYLSHLSDYNKLLLQRNAALKVLKHQQHLDNTLLQSYNEPLVSHAEYIFTQRSACLRELVPIVNEIYNKIANDDKSISISYESDVIPGQFLRVLEDSLSLDLLTERSNKGIHKDQIHLLINGEQLKNFASQGQIKTFVLALKLAQFKLLQSKHANDPILLLDDIFAKLDQQRMMQLIGVIQQLQINQCIITDTSQEIAMLIKQEWPDDVHVYTLSQDQQIKRHEEEK